MLPASRNRSNGRMSAPFHDAASKASAPAQSIREPSPGPGRGSAAAVALPPALLQLCQLAVELGELALLLRRGHALVAGDLGALAVELEDAERLELLVARLDEPGVVEIPEDD